MSWFTFQFFENKQIIIFNVGLLSIIYKIVTLVKLILSSVGCLVDVMRKRKCNVKNRDISYVAITSTLTLIQPNLRYV